MKILLDTNVLIAAFIARGVYADLLEHCIGRHEVLTSEFILAEFAEKLARKFKAENDETKTASHLLRSRLRVVSYAPLAHPICRDADDDNILAAAVSSECDCIITGDKALLVLKQFGSCLILSPSDVSTSRDRRLVLSQVEDDEKVQSSTFRLLFQTGKLKLEL